jgi:hypothetical protein
VLQHLSNRQIAALIPKIQTKYRYFILTEHLPIKRDFKHNIDKPSGPGIRTQVGSGIVLTSPPFNLVTMSQKSICSVSEFGGLVETMVYKLK